jgi:hypothetical protein
VIWNKRDVVPRAERYRSHNPVAWKSSSHSPCSISSSPLCGASQQGRCGRLVTSCGCCRGRCSGSRTDKPPPARTYYAGAAGAGVSSRGRIAVAFGHYPEFSPAAPINAWAAFFGRCLSSRLVACIDRCKSFGTSCPIAALTATPFHFSSWTKAACCAMRSSSFSTRRCGSRRARRRVDEASSTDKLIEMGEYIGIGARVFVALRKSSARGGLGLPGVYHAVTPHCRVALCSTEPGIRSEWAEPPASQVTCKICLDRLKRLRARLGCRADIVRSALGLAWAAGLALG